MIVNILSLFLVLGMMASHSCHALKQDMESIPGGFGSTSSPVDPVCMARHCSSQSASCFANKDCRAAVACASKCLSEWDNDTTPEKYHVQNCSNICAFSYMGKIYDNFMSCLGDNKCINFPPIPNRCKAPGNITFLKKLATKDLQGRWWAVKGYHPVYDCYPCQHLTFTQINETSWSYMTNYQVYLQNGTLGLMHDHYVMPNTNTGEIPFKYYELGLFHYETWWLYDAADDGSYIQLYYCGNTYQWYYDGSLVLSRTPTLPDSTYATIAASCAKATGLDLGKFCSTSTNQCPD